MHQGGDRWKVSVVADTHKKTNSDGSTPLSTREFSFDISESNPRDITVEINNPKNSPADSRPVIKALLHLSGLLGSKSIKSIDLGNGQSMPLGQSADARQIGPIKQ